jgi:predicted amidohydrolase YtcJ
MKMKGSTRIWVGLAEAGVLTGFITNRLEAPTMFRKPVRRVETCCRLALLLGGMTFSASAIAQSLNADTIYVQGDILTMNDKAPTAQALAVKDGRIVAVGDRETVEAQAKGARTQVVDLQGRTVLPGFVDAHSHYFSSLTVANQCNLYAPPAGPGKDVSSIVAAIRKFADEKRVPKGEIIQCYGYDENVMPDGRQLNRDDLDAAFPDNPVLAGHVSMHGAVLNSAALKKWGISADTKTAPGGVIVRKPGTDEPYGLIMETAYLPIFASLPKPTADQEVEWSIAGQKLYAQAGITTAHEGATHAEELALMQRAAKSGRYLIDVVAYPFVTDLEATLKANPIETWGKYENRLKIGGVKITIDGSPQGRTAFFTTPYLAGGPGGEKDWRGELAASPELITKAVKGVYDLGVPLDLHANGDGAIDAFFTAHEAAAAGDLGSQRHVTMVHSQFARKDQLDKFVQYRIRPSFYTLHTYYFADAHIKNRGEAQASYISPMRDAIDKGLQPTNHTDFVVAPLDQMFMLWSAVNRVSRSGAVIGADQRVTPTEGLKAMTIWAADQHREGDRKGSLEAGKLADLVILDANPTKVAPMAIKDIRVVETIKEGKTIYRREPGGAQ